MRKCNKYVKVVAFYLSVVPVGQMACNIGTTLQRWYYQCEKTKKHVNVVAFCVSVVPEGQTVGNVVPDAICQYLANHISTKWKRLGIQLSIGIDVLNSIDHENRLVWEKSIMMLKTWKEKFDDKATVEVLRKALENIGRNDLSKEVRGMSIPSSVNPVRKCSLL